MNKKLLIKKDISKEDWSGIINLFADASFYQTLPFGATRWGANNLEYAILYEDSKPLAATQLAIKRVPLLNAGIAYIKWGPMWRRKDKKEDISIFNSCLKALYDEYVIKRGLLLRIIPFSPIQLNSNGYPEQQFYEEGYQKCKDASSYKTFYLNLDYSLEELRKSLKHAWRNQLYKAENLPIKFEVGTELELYDQFYQIYVEMVKRKGFKDPINIKAYRRIQEELSSDHKMMIMLCKLDGKLTYANIIVTIGNIALDLLAATSNAGLKSCCSFLAQWKIIEWLKAHDFKWYDLGGIDKEENPGGYQFKSGLAGKLGMEVEFSGQFEACQNGISSALLKSADYFTHIRNKPRSKGPGEHNKQLQSQPGVN